MTANLTKDEAYARLGTITRDLHEALNVLGDYQLHDILLEIPNARDRLSHVGKMTEDAANKVLNLVDAAKPLCDELSAQSKELARRFALAGQSPEFNLGQAHAKFLECGIFAQQAAHFAQGQGASLTDIMMSQDFQDLSGQVIKKVINIINLTELQLVELLVDSAPNPVKSEFTRQVAPAAKEQDWHGPQTAKSALAQSDVDNLLASLGF